MHCSEVNVGAGIPEVLPRQPQPQASLSFEVPEDAPGCLGAVERVEVNPRSALLEKLAALLGGMVNATALDFHTVVLQRFNALEQSGRNVCPAHLCESFDLR